MAFLVWSLALLLLLLGTWVTLRRLKPVPHTTIGDFPPISILKPLKGADPGLRENLISFFELKYPEFEVIFSIAEERDPALKVVRDLMQIYGRKNIQLIVGAVEVGENPKVNNLIRSYHLAKYDVLLISDSNVKVNTDYLSKVMSHFSEKVGVITAVVAGVNPAGIGGYLEAIYLNTFYARGMNLAFLFGKPCVVGKSMLFRKSNAEKFGGIEATANYVAEDFVIGEEMRKLGLSVVLMCDPIEQFIGNYSFRSFWSRHIRWGRIRKSQAILPFLIEPFVTPLFSALALGLVVERRHKGFFIFGFAAQIIIWCACDMLLAHQLTKKLNEKYIAAWFLRESLSIPMWLVVAAGNTVHWRGSRLRLHFGGRILERIDPCRTQNHFSGGRPQARTKWKATINTATGGIGRSKAILPEV